MALMELKVAKSAGFCFGVNRAVQKTYDVIENTKRPIYALGDIINNTQVIDDLKFKGLKMASDLDDIHEGEACVVIRAHGVGMSIYQKIEKKGYDYVDVTCPYVKKIHKLVAQKHKDGSKILIVGDARHPEVIGINGWCDNTAFILSEPEELIELGNEKYVGQVCVVCQTTFTEEKWKKIADAIKKFYPTAIFYNTICNATSERQNEAIELAKESDIVLVIGDKKSSNTKKLYEVSKEWCDRTYFIEEASDVPSNLDGIQRISITAGASTPQWMIDEVVQILKGKL